MKQILFVIFLFLFAFNGGSSGPANAEQSPSSDEGKKFVESYVAAFNSGEEAMKAFFTENVASVALARRPVEARVQIYRQMRQNFIELTLRSIQRITNNSIIVRMQSKQNESLRFTFELEPGSPLKMVAIQIEDADDSESAKQPVITEKEAMSTIKKLLDEKTKSDEFSGAVLIAKLGKEIFKKAYGLASKEFKVPNRTDTKFNLGSINKTFTKIAIGQFVHQGKLSLTDPIIKYLPDYLNQEAAQKVTIQHLLDMTSGIRDFFGERFEATPKDKFRSINDFLPMFAGDPLEFEPGTQNRYSNGGYIVLGAIIEKISGQSYYEYVREHIFTPAGMLHTESYEADVSTDNLAEGYTRESPKDQWRKNMYSRPARGSSAGGGYSTVDDLLKFTIALDKDIFSTGSAGGGIGIFGGAPGINAGIETGIGEGYTAIIMCNYDPPSAEGTMKKVREYLSRIR